MAMMNTPTAAVEPAYIALIHAFPLRPLRSDRDLDDAIAMTHRLLDRSDLSDAERDYLDVLGSLIEAYEDEHVPIPPVTGVEALRHLMEENGLTQRDLIPLLGTRSVVSEVLNGNRNLSKNHIKALSAHFGLPADVFLH